MFLNNKFPFFRTHDGRDMPEISYLWDTVEQKYQAAEVGGEFEAEPIMPTGPETESGENGEGECPAEDNPYSEHVIVANRDEHGELLFVAKLDLTPSSACLLDVP